MMIARNAFLRDAVIAGTSATLAGLPIVSSAQQNAKLVVGETSRTATTWPDEIAQDQGYFDREHLSVEYIYTGNNAAVTQQVVAGSLDFGITTIETAIRAILQNAPIVMVSSGMLKFPYTYMTAASITKPSDLRGKKAILDLPKSMLSFTWRRWLEANKVAPEDVDLVYDGSSTNRFAALVSGAVQAAALTQPLDFLASDRGFKHLFDTSSFARTFGFTAAVAKTSWLADPANQAKLRGYLRAVSHGTDFFYDRKNRDACVAMLVNFAKVDPPVAQRTYDYYTTDIKPFAKNAALPDEYINTVSNYLVTAGDLPAPAPPVSKFVDRRYLPG
jgi:NitT/TauT family transport system substrate-binding protein